MMPDINCKWYIFDYSSLVLHGHQCNHLWFSKLACSPGGSVWLNLVFITPNLRDKYNSWKLIKVFHLFSDILMCFNKHFDIYHECISLELLFFDVIYLAIMPIIHTNTNKCHLFLTWSLYCKYTVFDFTAPKISCTSSISNELVFLVRSWDSWSGASVEGTLSGVEVRFCSFSCSSSFLNSSFASSVLWLVGGTSSDTGWCSPLSADPSLFWSELLGEEMLK